MKLKINKDFKNFSITFGERFKWYPIKFLENLCTFLGVLTLVWILISYIQVLSHSLDGITGNHFVYPDWNFFKFLLNLF